jgi:hypothetical protein
MSQVERDRLLAWAARRARSRDSYVASDLAAFQERHGLSEAQLANWLGGTIQALTNLALCRRPQADAPSFRTDVERIALHVGVQGEALARLLRETDTIAALRSAPADASAPTDHGSLMAARDRQDGHDAGAPPGQKGSPRP